MPLTLACCDDMQGRIGEIPGRDDCDLLQAKFLQVLGKLLYTENIHECDPPAWPEHTHDFLERTEASLSVRDIMDGFAGDHDIDASIGQWKQTHIAIKDFHPVCYALGACVFQRSLFAIGA